MQSSSLWRSLPNLAAWHHGRHLSAAGQLHTCLDFQDLALHITEVVVPPDDLCFSYRMEGYFSTEKITQEATRNIRERSFTVTYVNAIWCRLSLLWADARPLMPLPMAMGVERAVL